MQPLAWIVLAGQNGASQDLNHRSRTGGQVDGLAGRVALIRLMNSGIQSARPLQAQWSLG
jgi:hypothetical protein